MSTRQPLCQSALEIRSKSRWNQFFPKIVVYKNPVYLFIYLVILFLILLMCFPLILFNISFGCHKINQIPWMKTQCTVSAELPLSKTGLSIFLTRSLFCKVLLGVNYITSHCFCGKNPGFIVPLFSLVLMSG